MEPFDYGRAFTEFWIAGSKAMLEAQDKAGRALADNIKAVSAGMVPTWPGLPTDHGAMGAELAQASKAMMDLWSAASSLFLTLTDKLPAGKNSETVQATLRHIMDPRSWMAGTGEMDDVLARMAEGPRFADLWDIERRYARVLHAWVEVRRRGLEHNGVVLQAWMRAGKRFGEELAGRTSADARRSDSKAVLALWTETANRELIETQRSDAFLKTQVAMIRASTELRLAQQDLVEHFGKQYGFPTRTELDDLARTVTELRREMRGLRRERSFPVPTPAEPAVPEPVVAEPVVAEPIVAAEEPISPAPAEPPPRRRPRAAPRSGAATADGRAGAPQGAPPGTPPGMPPGTP